MATTAWPPLADVSLSILMAVTFGAIALFSGLLVARETRSGRRRGCGGRAPRGAAYSALGDQPTTARTWYDQEALKLAPWQPPAAMFGIVWGLLYAIMGTVGVLLLRRVTLYGETNLYYILSVAAWLVLVVLNLAWTPAFYWAHRVSLALAILLLSAVIAVGQLPLLWYAAHYASVTATAGATPTDVYLLAAFGLSFAPTAWLCYALSLNAYTAFATRWHEVREFPPPRPVTLA